MKLTNAHRDDFVRRVMQALPKPAYQARLKSMAELRADIESLLPADVQRVVKKYPDIFIRRSHYVAFWGVSIYAVTLNDNIELPAYDKSTQAPFEQECEAHKSYRSRLAQITGACNTLKQLHEAFPELKDYMPADSDVPTPNLPVAAGGLVSDLLKAGLPMPSASAKKAGANAKPA